MKVEELVVAFGCWFVWAVGKSACSYVTFFCFYALFKWDSSKTDRKSDSDLERKITFSKDLNFGSPKVHLYML